MEVTLADRQQQLGTIPLPRDIATRPLWPETREPQREGGQDKEIERGGGDEAAEDDDGHGAFDFAAGFAGADGQREQAERGHEGRHHDRDEPLGGAAKRGLEVPGASFHRDEMIEMGDHHDGIAGGDAEERDEAHERADGEGAAAEERRQHAADEREGQVREDQEKIAGVCEDERKQQDNARRRQ